MSSTKIKPTMKGKELLQYRESLNISFYEMADLIGVSWQAVRLWEKDQRQIPETTVRLIRLFQKFPQLRDEF